MAVVSTTSSFLQNQATPGREWKKVGYLDMTDPTQQCPDSWQKITSPRSSCGKKSIATCDSLNIITSGASYQKEIQDQATYLNKCTPRTFYGTDSSVEEVRAHAAIHQTSLESFELYIQVAIPLMNIQAASVLNPDNTLSQLDISWIPVGGNVTIYTVSVLGADGSVGQGCTVCTTSPCLYVYQITHVAVYYNISVASINPDGTLGSQNSINFSSTNSIFQNISSLSYSNSIDCSFLNNQSFYCVVCCSTDPSVPPDSSVYSISTAKSTEVTVSLQGLTGGHMYYCKAAATSTNSTRCAGPVVGGVKMYCSFVASLPNTTFPTTSNLASIDIYYIIGITIVTSFLVFFSLGVLVTTCICCMKKMKSKVTLPHPALEPSVYEMIETDKKRIKAIE
ncbi:hypothetical protein EMCRGX_G001054 [Ephydatia muelleri]